MSYSWATGISGLALLAALCGQPNAAAAEGMKDLVGAWTVVSSDTVRQDGTRSPTFGPSPKGIVIFDASGRYALELARADMAKLASGNRLEGSADENKAVAQGALAHFGSFTVDEAGKTLILRIESSSFPNWSGTEQRRPFTVAGDDLKWTTPSASGGGSAELVWKRAKPVTQ